MILAGIAGLLSMLAAWSPVPISYLFREPYSIGHMPLYVGLISNFGALLWSCTIGICLFTYIVLKTSAEASAGNVLLFPAAFSLVLLLDDVLMIHERVIGPLLPNGQLITYLVYGLATIYFVLRYRRVLLTSSPGVLLLSVGLLGGSAGLDVLKEVFSVSLLAAHQHIIVEDGLKLMGIATWLYYFGYLSCVSLEQHWRPAESQVSCHVPSGQSAPLHPDLAPSPLR